MKQDMDQLKQEIKHGLDQVKQNLHELEAAKRSSQTEVLNRIPSGVERCKL